MRFSAAGVVGAGGTVAGAVNLEAGGEVAAAGAVALGQEVQ